MTCARNPAVQSEAGWCERVCGSALCPEPEFQDRDPRATCDDFVGLPPGMLSSGGSCRDGQALFSASSGGSPAAGADVLGGGKNTSRISVCVSRWSAERAAPMIWVETPCFAWDGPDVAPSSAGRRDFRSEYRVQKVANLSPKGSQTGLAECLRWSPEIRLWNPVFWFITDRLLIGLVVWVDSNRRPQHYEYGLFGLSVWFILTTDCETPVAFRSVWQDRAGLCPAKF